MRMGLKSKRGWCPYPLVYSQYGEPPPTTRAPTRPQPDPEPEALAEPVGNLEVPGGIGFVSGWVCDRERVEIIIAGGLHIPPVARNIGRVAWNISRGDTEAVCGDQDNGFITQWNWTLMGEGTYTAALVVDGKTVQIMIISGCGLLRLKDEYPSGCDVIANRLAGRTNGELRDAVAVQITRRGQGVAKL